MGKLIDEDIANKSPSVTPLSKHQKFILSQMVNSDVKTIEEIGLMHQKQLAEMYQQRGRKMEKTIDETLEYLTDFDLYSPYQEAIDKVSAYIKQMQADYEARLKAERKKIAEAVADKMDYMYSCANERNIILGIIIGERETTESLCSTCKAPNCVSNGTAISKSDYESRLKDDMVAMLEELDLQIDESAAYNLEVAKVQRLIRDRIDKLKGE